MDNEGMPVGVRVGLGFCLLLLVMVAQGMIAVLGLTRNGVQMEESRAADSVSDAIGNLRVTVGSFGSAIRPPALALSEHDLESLQKADEALAENLRALSEAAREIRSAEEGMHLVKIGEELRVLNNEAAALSGAVNKARGQFDAAHMEYMKLCGAMLQALDELMQKGIETKMPGETLQTLRSQMVLASVLFDAGHRSRALMLTAFAARDPRFFNEATEALSKVDNTLDELLKQGGDKRQMEIFRGVRQNAVTCWKMLDNLRKRVEDNLECNHARMALADRLRMECDQACLRLREERKEVAAYVMETNETLKMVQIAGLAVSVMLGLVLALLIARSVSRSASAARGAADPYAVTAAVPPLEQRVEQLERRMDDMERGGRP